jgi:hypothetical protein
MRSGNLTGFVEQFFEKVGYSPVAGPGRPLAIGCLTAIAVPGEFGKDCILGARHVDFEGRGRFHAPGRDIGTHPFPLMKIVPAKGEDIDLESAGDVDYVERPVVAY